MEAHKNAEKDREICSESLSPVSSCPSRHQLENGETRTAAVQDTNRTFFSTSHPCSSLTLSLRSFSYLSCHHRPQKQAIERETRRATDQETNPILFSISHPYSYFFLSSQFS